MIITKLKSFSLRNGNIEVKRSTGVILYSVYRVLIPKMSKIRHVNIAIKVGKCNFVQRKMPEDKTKSYFKTNAKTKKCNAQKRNWFRHLSVICRTFHLFLSRLAAVMLPPRVLSDTKRVELPTGGVELLKKILIETDFK